MKPSLCFVGPMVSRRSGTVTPQLQTICELFKSIGYPVTSVSPLANRLMRLADIIITLIRKRSSIDILIIDVFSGTSFVVADIAGWLGKQLGKPVLMVLRGGALPQFIKRHPDWARRVLHRADVIVAPSKFLARVAVQQGLTPWIIPNVIDLSAYPFRHRQRVRPRLFWMRSFHSIYNPSMAVCVVSRLMAVMPDTSLVMAGPDKGLQENVERLAKEKGLNGAVRFPGVLDQAGKAREANMADIFLVTNRVDNMPVTAVEACAMGMPVIATAVGGIPDLLTDGETGLLVPDDDDEAMAGAIHRLVNEPELVGRLSKNGRRLAERSSWEQTRPIWEGLFVELMKRPRVRGSQAAIDE